MIAALVAIRDALFTLIIFWTPGLPYLKQRERINSDERNKIIETANETWHSKHSNNQRHEAKMISTFLTLTNWLNTLQVILIDPESYGSSIK